MNNKEKLESINALNLDDMKKLFKTYLYNTKKNIDKSTNTLDILQHANNLNVVLARDIGKFIG
jgi:hypothetical protein|tara:strand:+ start:61 stop:249 length:189 start_codon:yes stop_codon:yes gene_type:complete